MRACLSELLRTAHRPPSLMLRVQSVVPQAVVSERHTTEKNPPQASRYYLTDDELIVQALVLPELRLNVEKGDILEVRQFEVKKAPRRKLPGQILFLGIYDCEIVERASAPSTSTEEGGFIREPQEPLPTSLRPVHKRQRSEAIHDSASLVPPLFKQPRPSASLSSTESSGDSNMEEPSGTQSSGDFETRTPSVATTQQRRQTLHEIDHSASPYSSEMPSKMPMAVEQERAPSYPTPELTNLADLPGLPPSTPVSLLVVVTWTGQTLLRNSQAFPPKRHVKLHDLSVSHLFSGVSLAAYIDAQNFKPERGTVALLQDVVMQQCGTGSGDVNTSHMLNAYANLPAKLEEKRQTLGWFVVDRDVLRQMGLGAKVEALRAWWDQREMKTGAASQLK